MASVETSVLIPETFWRLSLWHKDNFFLVIKLLLPCPSFFINRIGLFRENCFDQHIFLVCFPFGAEKVLVNISEVQRDTKNIL